METDILHKIVKTPEEIPSVFHNSGGSGPASGHQQRGADGEANEWCGNSVAHSCVTFDWDWFELATVVVTRVPGETLY